MSLALLALDLAMTMAVAPLELFPATCEEQAPRSTRYRHFDFLLARRFGFCRTRSSVSSARGD